MYPARAAEPVVAVPARRPVALLCRKPCNTFGVVRGRAGHQLIGGVVGEVHDRGADLLADPIEEE